MCTIRYLLVLAVMLLGCTPQSRGVVPQSRAVTFVHSPSLMPTEIPIVPEGRARIFVLSEFQGLLLSYMPSIPLRIDGVTIGRFPIDAAMFWDVSPGRHEIAVDSSFADQWGIEIVRGEMIRLSAGEEAFVSLMLEYDPIQVLPKPICPSSICVWVETVRDPVRQDIMKDRIRRPVYKNIQ